MRRTLLRSIAAHPGTGTYEYCVGLICLDSLVFEELWSEEEDGRGINRGFGRVENKRETEPRELDGYVTGAWGIRLRESPVDFLSPNILFVFNVLILRFCFSRLPGVPTRPTSFISTSFSHRRQAEYDGLHL